MNNREKADLVGRAHSLNPVVMIGQKGLTSNVIAETDQALNVHELIKVKIVGEDKHQRTEMAEKLANELKAEFLKLIGSIAIIYREKEQD